MIMYKRLHASFVKAMQQHFHLSILVQQSLIQVISLMLDADMIPVIDCMLQPQCADPGKMVSPFAVKPVLASANADSAR